MKNKEYWINWIKAAGIRAIKTLAQTTIGVIGTSVVLGDVNWVMVGSSAALAAILSILTSIAGLPEINSETSTKTTSSTVTAKTKKK